MLICPLNLPYLRLVEQTDMAPLPSGVRQALLLTVQSASALDCRTQEALPVNIVANLCLHGCEVYVGQGQRTRSGGQIPFITPSDRGEMMVTKEPLYSVSERSQCTYRSDFN